MGIRVFAFGLLWAASLYAQARHFSWQEACFRNSLAAFCPDREYAVKPVPPAKDTGSGVVTNWVQPPPQRAAPSVIVVGGTDWRFADPFPHALVGFNFSSLSASPVAKSLIVQLVASLGLTEADTERIFKSLAGAERVVFSASDKGTVILVTGRLAETSVVPEAGWKSVPIAGTGMLIGDAEAVNQAAQRIAMGSPSTELTRLAEQLAANNELWAIGPGRLAGPQAVSAGVKQVSLAISIGDHLTSDAAFEFWEAPSANMPRVMPAAFGSIVVEGNVVHARMSVYADEMQQRFSQIASTPFGQNLSALVKTARNLPECCDIVARPAKPTIYGLEGGPREVK